MASRRYPPRSPSKRKSKGVPGSSSTTSHDEIEELVFQPAKFTPLVKALAKPVSPVKRVRKEAAAAARSSEEAVVKSGLGSSADIDLDIDDVFNDKPAALDTLQKATRFVKWAHEANTDDRWLRSSWNTIFVSSRCPDTLWEHYELFTEQVCGATGKQLPADVMTVPIKIPNEPDALLQRLAPPWTCFWEPKERKPRRSINQRGEDEKRHLISQENTPTTARLGQMTLNTPSTSQNASSATAVAMSTPVSTPTSTAKRIRAVIRTPQHVPATTLPTGTSMTPPPASTHQSRDEAFAAAQRHALYHGYLLTIVRTSKGGILEARCHRGGRTPEDREDMRPRAAAGTRSTARLGITRMVGCKFSLSIKKHIDNKLWAIHIGHSEHTGHDADLDIALTIGKKLREAEKERIATLRFESPNILPAQIMAALNKDREKDQWPPLSEARPIYNELMHLQQKKRQERPDLEDAISQLRQDGLVVECSRNPVNGEAESIFFMSKEVSEIIKNLDHVLAIDATYSTNEHGYALVQLVGILPWESPLPLAVALLLSEDTTSYSWVLSHYLRLRNQQPPALVVTDADQALMNAVAIKMSTTPAILCHWHASQNVEHKGCGKMTREDSDAFVKAWKSMVEAETEERADAHWEAIKEDFAAVPGGNHAIQYVSKTWRSSSKWPKIGACFTNQVRHFGVRTTSVVEASHSSLKATLPKIVYRRKLFVTEIVRAVAVWLKKRLTASRAALQNNRRTPAWLRDDERLIALRGRLSHAALDVFHKQLQAADVAFRRQPLKELKLALEHQCTSSLDEAQRQRLALIATPTSDANVKSANKQHSTASDDQAVKTVNQPAVREEGRPAVDPDNLVQQEMRPSRVCVVWTATGVICKHRLLCQMADDALHVTLDDFASFHHLPSDFGAVGADSDSEEQEQQNELAEPMVALDHAVGQFADDIRKTWGDACPPDLETRLAKARAAFNADAFDDNIEGSLKLKLRAPPKARKSAPRRIGLKESHGPTRRLRTGNEAQRERRKQAEHTARLTCSRCGGPGHTKKNCTATREEVAEWGQQTLQSLASAATPSSETETSVLVDSQPTPSALEAVEELDVELAALSKTSKRAYRPSFMEAVQLWSGKEAISSPRPEQDRAVVKGEKGSDEQQQDLPCLSELTQPTSTLPSQSTDEAKSTPALDFLSMPSSNQSAGNALHDTYAMSSDHQAVSPLLNRLAALLSIMPSWPSTTQTEEPSATSLHSEKPLLPSVEKSKGQSAEPVRKSTRLKSSSVEPVQESTKVKSELTEPVRKSTRLKSSSVEPVQESTKVGGESTEPVRESTDSKGKAVEPVCQLTKLKSKSAEQVEEGSQYRARRMVERKAVNTSQVRQLLLKFNGKITSVPADGNCGYHAIGHQIGEKDPWKVRLNFMQWLDAEADRSLGFVSRKCLDGVKARLFPDGRKPTLRALNSMKKAKMVPVDLWLSNTDCWLLAEWLGRPVCTLSQDNAAGFATYLPFSALPKGKVEPALGLIFSVNHWEAIELSFKTTLPPVSLQGWGRFAEQHLANDSHSHWHRLFTFERPVNAKKDGCGCYVQGAQVEEIIELD